MDEDMMITFTKNRTPQRFDVFLQEDQESGQDYGLPMKENISWVDALLYVGVTQFFRWKITIHNSDIVVMAGNTFYNLENLATGQENMVLGFVRESQLEKAKEAIRKLR